MEGRQTSTTNGVTMTHTTQRNKSECRILGEIDAVLDHIDPSIGYTQWVKVLMAIKHETRGSDEGFELADRWSSAGNNYKGTNDVYKQWRCIKEGHKNPVTMGTLKWMARNM